MSDIIPQDTLQGNLIPETTFIYKLIDPETQEIRYVGKANDPQKRLKQHIAHSQNQAKGTYIGYWIASLRKRGLKPLLEIIEEVSFAIWQERELYWINHYIQHGHNLVNTYFGGKGVGMVPPEVRAKMALARTGKKRSPEAVAKLIASKTGMKYKPISEEGRRNMGNSRRGMKYPPEFGAKVAATKKGKKRDKPMSEEWRHNLGNATRGKKQSPEHVAKRIESRLRTLAMRNSPPDTPSLWPHDG